MSARGAPCLNLAVRRPGDRSASALRVGLWNIDETSEGFDVYVISFKFEDDEKKADKVTLVVDNYDLSQLDGDLWTPGNEIEFSFGYPGLMSPKRSATITVLKGFEKLTIEADAKEVVIGRVQRTDRLWENVRRSDVVRELAREYGFKESEIFIEESPFVVESVTQAGMTDHQLIRSLAVRDGLEFYIDQDGFHFKSRDLSQVPTRVLTYFTDPGEGDILSISLETDKRQPKPGAITAAGKDPNTGQPFEVTATNDTTANRSALAPTSAAVGPKDDVIEMVDGVTGQTHIVQRPVVASEGQAAKGQTGAKTQGEAEHQVNAAYKANALKGATLTLKIVGDPLMHAKKVVRVERVGKKLSGNWYAKSASHDITGDYTTTLKTGRDNLNADGTVVKGNVNDKPGDKKSGSDAGGGELVLVEVVDPVTGLTRLEYRPKGAK